MKHPVLFLLCCGLHSLLWAGHNDDAGLVANAGPDLVVCNPGESVTLMGQAFGNFSSVSWSPSTGLSDPNSLTPTVTVNGTTTYTLTVVGNSPNNLITNGDFSMGTSGFTSDYVPGTGGPFGLLSNEGQYAIATNPDNTHNNFASCGDQSGDGNMMVVNGSTTLGQNVWCQTVTVVPGTLYNFETWITSVNPDNPAILQFSVNGATIGAPFNASPTLCSWQPFNATWTATGTTATICIVNQNTAGGGNDFAIDGLFFGEVCTSVDDVTVSVVNLVADAPSPVSYPCAPPNAIIQLTGSSNQLGPNVSYLWTTVDGSILAGANTLTPSVNAPGTYELTVSYQQGTQTCTANATVVVVPEIPPAAIATTPGPITCANPQVVLSGVGSSFGPNILYEWTTIDGIIVSGANGVNPIVAAPGTYTLTVTDIQSGCTAVATTIVGANTTPPQAIAQVIGQVSCNQDPITLDGSNSLAPGNATFTWSTFNGITISNGVTATVGQAGIYVLTVTDPQNGCQDANQVVVGQSTDLPQIVILPNALNCISSTSSIDATNSDTGPNLTVQWTTSDGNITAGANSYLPFIDGPGTYVMTLSDTDSGCTNVDSVTLIVEGIPPVFALNGPTTFSCADSSLQLIAVSTPGNTYQWDTGDGEIIAGSNDSIASIAAAGTYNLVLTSLATGCDTTVSITVLPDTIAPVVDAGPTQTLSCSNPVDTLLGSGSATGSFLINWSTADGQIISGGDSFSPEVDAPGWYQLTLTNEQNGCTATDSVEVLQDNDLPQISLNTALPINCLRDSVSLSATGSTVSSAIVASWSTNDGTLLPGANDYEAFGGSAGTYVFSLMDTISGCSSIDSLVIEAFLDQPQVVIAAADTLTCETEVVELDASGSLFSAQAVLQWSTTNGDLQGPDDQHITQAGQAGWYQLLIQDTLSGCFDLDSVFVENNQAIPNIQIAMPDTLSCEQEMVVLDASGSSPGAYQWLNAAGDLLGTNTLQTINQAGAFFFSVTDLQSNCTRMDTVHVLQDTIAPLLLTDLPDTLTCVQTSVSLTATGSDQGSHISGSWMDEQGNNLPVGVDFSTVVQNTGLYTLTLSNSINSCVSQDTVLVVENVQQPSVQIALPDTITCTTLSSLLDGNGSTLAGPSDFFWTSSDGVLNQAPDQAISEAGMTGWYQLEVTDQSSGCSDLDSVFVESNQNYPMIQLPVADTLNCLITEVLLDATGSDSGQYQWSDLGGNPLGDALQQNVASPGAYVFSITNPDNDCTSLDTLMVVQDVTPPLADILPPDSLTCVQASVLLDAQHSIFTAGSSLQWTGPDNQVTIGNDTYNANQAGTYQLLISQATNGCVDSVSITVAIDTMQPMFNLLEADVLNCVRLSDTLTADHTFPEDFLFSWSQNGQIIDQATSAELAVDVPATYSLQITNPANGCSATEVVTVLQDTDLPDAQAMAADTLDCATNQVDLVGFSNTAGDLTYSWAALSGELTTTTNPTSTLQPGQYQLSVLNQDNGCEQTTSLTVLQDTISPLIAVNAPDPITCVQTSVDLTGSLVQPVAGATFQWSGINQADPPNNDQINVSVQQAGSYQLQVTNPANGCSAIAIATVSLDVQPPTADAGDDGMLDCFAASLPLSGSSTTAVTFNWGTADGNILGDSQQANVLVDQPGTYQLTVTSLSNGCTSTDAVSISADYPTDFVFEVSPPPCPEDFGSILFGSIAGGVAPYTYSIDGGNTFQTSTFFSGLSPDSYSLVIEDANGCQLSDSGLLASPLDPQIAIDELFVTALGDEIQLFAQLNIDTSEVISIQWMGPDSLSCYDCVAPVVVFPRTTGRYQITVTTQNGCIATASTLLRVDRQLDIYAPNIFSPNLDGINDYFTLFTEIDAVEQINYLQVFSRWGESLFLRENFAPNVPQLGWDGTHKGQTMNPAVFGWVAEVQLLDGSTVILKGDVTLKR